MWEAFPTVILEAAASDVPVITTPVGSVGSLVDNTNGYIVSIDNFKEAMVDVMCNYEEAKIRSAKLLQEVRSNYHIRNIIAKYEDIYLGLME